VKTILTAKWIAPVSRPLIRDGAVVIGHGRVLDVGMQADILPRHADAAVTALGCALVIPGLVNAHTHLELSDITRESPPAGGFVGWLRQMIARSIAGSRELASRCSMATLHGIEQCLRFGVTCVGDITAQPAATRPVLAHSSLRAVSFGEVRAMGANRSLLEERIAQATDGGAPAPPGVAGASGRPGLVAWASRPWCRYSDAEMGMHTEDAGSDALRIGLSPHSPYSVELPGYARCLAVARQRGIPLATHLSENPAEAEFLERQSGPFRELWNTLPWWDKHIPRFAGGPIRMAHSLGLLDFPAVLAHVNCCDDAELDLLAAGRASVVYCPRTSAWFGHPPHRFREMLARGINVALGTDSCASSPDLDLLEEARCVHRLAPDVPPDTLFQMITLNGARAIGWAGELGSLDPGKHADLAVFATMTDDPLREILEASLLPDRVFIAGRDVTDLA
jgi:cytosine/adenosine deaminase-related metal-dependent hydrolase